MQVEAEPAAPAHKPEQLPPLAAVALAAETRRGERIEPWVHIVRRVHRGLKRLQLAIAEQRIVGQGPAAASLLEGVPIALARQVDAVCTQLPRYRDPDGTQRQVIHISDDWLQRLQQASCLLDLFCELRCQTNGLQLPVKNDLLGALSLHGLEYIPLVEKEEMGNRVVC